MFHVSIDSITKGSLLRQKGKIAELALGYGGSIGALKKMGGEQMGLSEFEMQEIVNNWRTANPNIVQLWYDVQNAAISALIRTSDIIEIRGCKFKYSKGLLWATLPSGRSLCYVTPRIDKNRFGGDSIIYWGINQTTRKWEKQETYGGKLVENLVQAIARDCMRLNSFPQFGQLNLRVVFISSGVTPALRISGVSGILSRWLHITARIYGLFPRFTFL